MMALKYTFSWKVGSGTHESSTMFLLSLKAGLLSQHDAIETGAGAADWSQQLRDSKPDL